MSNDHTSRIVFNMLTNLDISWSYKVNILIALSRQGLNYFGSRTTIRTTARLSLGRTEKSLQVFLTLRP